MSHFVAIDLLCSKQRAWISFKRVAGCVVSWLIHVFRSTILSGCWGVK